MPNLKNTIFAQSILLASLFFSGSIAASPDACKADALPDAMVEQAEFQEILKQNGYPTWNEFKVEDKCYEIYTEVDGQKTEIYFDGTKKDLTIVKQKTKS